jgi:hypothetical protein
MIKNIINSIKRWIERLAFRFRHREGWSEKFAKDFLSNVNGMVSVQDSRAFKSFVETIAKIERSRISAGKKRRWIEDEKRILQQYGFAYHDPNLRTRLDHEEIRRQYINLCGYPPHPSIFAIS